LSNVYSLLADLIDWSDKLLLLKINDIKIQINNDEKYKNIAHDLIEAIKVKINSIEIFINQKFFHSIAYH
jgi:hypothetical protein